MEFWSDPIKIRITSGVLTQALSSIAVPNISGYSIERAYAVLGIDCMEEAAGGTPALDSDQYIQVDKAAAGYINAIKLLDDSFSMSANQRITVFGKIQGSLDVNTRVAFNTTTDFRWESSATHVNSSDIWLRSGLIIWVTQI